MNTLLPELIEQFYQALSQFEGVLEQERDLLEKHELERYDTLIQQKENVTKKLHQLQQQALSEYFMQESPKAAMNKAIQQYPEPQRSAMTQSWHKAMGTLQRCHRMNQANALVVQASRNITDHFLDLITMRDKNRTYSKYAQTEATIESTQSKRV